MRTAALLMLLVAPSLIVGACKPEEPDDEPAEPQLPPCGLVDPSIADFTLEDMIPGSPTHGEAVSLSDHAEKVVLIFWMTAT